MTDKAYAVVYARVSSKAQTERGQGLASQITRCCEYARYMDAEVLEIFQDDMSGRIENRPGMLAMLTFLKKNKSKQYLVIIDDISRLARNIDAHRSLRKRITQAGGILVSPNISFGESAIEALNEDISMVFADHQSKMNAEQTVNRMRACLMRGHWPLPVPMGYERSTLKSDGKKLIRDEPLASIIQKTLKAYASGRLQTQSEVKRYLEKFPRGSDGYVHPQRVKNLLTRVVYTGYLEHHEWNVSLRKGNHEGLIDYQTFQKIQDRLNGAANAPARKDLSSEFPLRGSICCADCGGPAYCKLVNKQHRQETCVLHLPKLSTE